MSFGKQLFVLIALCAMAVCEVASAQVYSGGMPVPGGTSPTARPGYTPKSYGINKAMIGAGAGAAAAGGLLFYEIRHHNVYNGCVGPDGNMLIRDKDGKQFRLEGQSLQPGEKVSIKAKKDSNDSSGETLEVVNVRKDYGRCESRVASTASAQQP